MDSRACGVEKQERLAEVKYACMVKRMEPDTLEMVPLPFTGSDALEN